MWYLNHISYFLEWHFIIFHILVDAVIQRYLALPCGSWYVECENRNRTLEMLLYLYPCCLPLRKDLLFLGGCPSCLWFQELISGCPSFLWLENLSVLLIFHIVSDTKTLIHGWKVLLDNDALVGTFCLSMCPDLKEQKEILCNHED